MLILLHQLNHIDWSFVSFEVHVGHCHHCVRTQEGQLCARQYMRTDTQGDEIDHAQFLHKHVLWEGASQQICHSHGRMCPQSFI